MIHSFLQYIYQRCYYTNDIISQQRLEGFVHIMIPVIHRVSELLYTNIQPCIVSYQNEETVGWEVLVSWDGWEHRENQAAEHQNEPKT